MRLFLLLFILNFIIFSMLNAETNKIKTEDGQNIILSSDGTWKYENNNNNSNFNWPKNADEIYKSPKKFVQIHYDSSKWILETNLKNSDAEIMFKFPSGDIYTFLVVERISIPLKTLKNLFIQNFKEKSKNVRIIYEKIKIVNNNKILCIKVNAELEGIKLTYYGYLWSGTKGTVQFFAATGQNIFWEYEKDLTDLLNGFEIIDKKPLNQQVRKKNKLKKRDNVYNQAVKLSNAMIKKDYNIIVNYLPDFMIKKMGGKEKSKRVFTELLESSSVTYESIKVYKAIQIVNDTDVQFSIVPTKTKMILKGTQAIMDGFLIGFSFDNGKNWKFTDGNNNLIATLLNKYPELFGKLNIPQRVQVLGSSKDGFTMRMIEVNGEWIPDNKTLNSIKDVLKKHEE